MATPLDEDTGRLFLHLKAAQGAARNALDDALSDMGISSQQLLILRAVELSPAISGAQLARECFVSPQTMATTIAKLEAAGLIVRSKGEGRVIETHLTDKGRAIFDRAGSRVQSAERYIAEVLGAGTVAELDRILRDFTDCLQKSLVVTTSRTWDTEGD
ncbi:MAG TPA: MarR family transcriptional regulator [Candidatus Acidoferrales bacterium]|nr:MarR family transcriptional regulator [Candidatus Acidoferrales bacterium]